MTYGFFAKLRPSHIADTYIFFTKKINNRDIPLHKYRNFLNISHRNMGSLWKFASYTLSRHIRDNLGSMGAGRPSGRNSSPGRVKNFLFSKSSRLALGSTQPPIQWVPEALSPGVKRLGREADHSPPTSAEVKKMWIYTSTPPYAFTA
jgi:hypothetical protein